jgi:hypothetical protein
VDGGAGFEGCEGCHFGLWGGEVSGFRYFVVVDEGIGGGWSFLADGDVGELSCRMCLGIFGCWLYAVRIWTWGCLSEGFLVGRELTVRFSDFAFGLLTVGKTEGWSYGRSRVTVFLMLASHSLVYRGPQPPPLKRACESGSQVGEEKSNLSHKVLDDDRNSSQEFRAFCQSMLSKGRLLPPAA